jgi:uncharacterized protein
MNNLPLLLEHIVVKLKNGLSNELIYHCVDHTLDVFKQSQSIALDEKITNTEELYLLKVGALYHDTGFLFIYNGHEELGCKLAMQELPAFGLDEKQIKIICGLIMATKIPQSPKNKLEEIICDADLDYLGRRDYEVISNNLYHEFLKEGIVKDDKEWLEKQIRFFESHQYFTASSKKNRTPLKLRHLEKLKVTQKEK